MAVDVRTWPWAMAVCGHTWMAVDAAVVWTGQWLEGVKSQTVAHGADELEEGERS